VKKTIVHVVMAICMTLIVLESSQVIELNLSLRSALAATALISSFYLLISMWLEAKARG